MKTLLVLAAATPLMAQSWYPRHNIHVGGGAGLPGEDLIGLFADRPSLSVGYGYRFHRNFQIDVGLDTVFGAAGIRDWLPTEWGYLRIKDYQFFLPYGGRAIIPIGGGRVLFSGGGGGTYMRYTERIRQPSSYYTFECPVCRARDGWGYYGLLGLNVAIDGARHFWVGATTKVYRGHTEGDPLGDVPGLRTRDRWVTVFGHVGVGF